MPHAGLADLIADSCDADESFELICLLALKLRVGQFGLCRSSQRFASLVERPLQLCNRALVGFTNLMKSLHLERFRYRRDLEQLSGP